MTYIKGIIGVLLLAAIAWGAMADYDAGKKAGEDLIQTAWDKDKADIAKLAADDAAENARKALETAANNARANHDLQAQIDSLRNLNSSLAQRLRLATGPAATDRSPVPQIQRNPGPITAAGTDRLGQIDDAIAATLTECAVNRENYRALIAEIKPQL